MADQITTSPDKNGKELKGWHVLLWMFGFFGIMFAVNGVFLYQALTTFPGEDVKKSYAQGLNYNQTLEARSAQTALGWRAEIGRDGDTIILHLEDKFGDALSNRSIIGELRRRTTQQADQVLIFKAGMGGDYLAATDGLAVGQWDVRISVLDLDTEQTLFSARKTLIVK